MGQFNNSADLQQRIKLIKTRINQIVYDRKLSSTDDDNQYRNDSELRQLRRELRDLTRSSVVSAVEDIREVLDRIQDLDSNGQTG